MAEHWIRSGLAKIVLIPHVTVQSTIPLPEVVAFFATAGMDLQWEYPFGTTYNGIIGLMANRFLYDTGTTPEEMASVVVAHRRWAALDPNSMFYKKRVPTIEDVLSSGMVATPLHKRECNMLADGGGAMVVTSAEIAKSMNKPVAYKLGEGATYFCACPTIRQVEVIEKGMLDTLEKALAEAGLTRDDMDIWNIYLAYPFLQLIALEAMGICERGQAGKFVMEGHTSPGGKCPASTMGDAIGRGHTGSGVSMATYLETARQLMGKAGEKQVPDATFVYQNTAGGSGMNHIATIWGREIP
jgi:acetyl-CoA C-acetyltransferase